MSLLHKKTVETTLRLRSLGYHVIEKWEHDFVKEKKENADLISFLSSHMIEDRLNPRDAFFGGRTNAIKLYYEGSAKYVDFTSLYPWVSFFFFTIFAITSLMPKFSFLLQYVHVLFNKNISKSIFYLLGK